MIIAGERRWRAAREAGIREIPCIEMDVDDRAVAEIALIENMQRKDLTPWEEADGLKALCDRFGYTHEEIARKVGKSRSAVTEALSISTMPEEIREKCRNANITSKSILLEIVRQPDDASMEKIAAEIISRGLTRDDARAKRKSQSFSDANSADKSPAIYRYVSPGKGFRLELRFRRSTVDQEDILDALREVYEKLSVLSRTEKVL
jgi:ParB family chromosome partitioning protein